MCLNTVQEKPDLSVYENAEVFKVLKRGPDGALRGQFAAILKTRDQGRWLASEDFSRTKILYAHQDGLPASYLAGWHSFPNEEDAKAWCLESLGEVVIKVKVRGIVALGTQEVTGHRQAPTVVSLDMFIPEEENEELKEGLELVPSAQDS